MGEDAPCGVTGRTSRGGGQAGTPQERQLPEGTGTAASRDDVRSNPCISSLTGGLAKEGGLKGMFTCKEVSHSSR